MQITSLEQCFNRQERAKNGTKSEDFVVTLSITVSYEHGSYFAYLRPTLPLVVFTRIIHIAYAISFVSFRSIKYPPSIKEQGDTSIALQIIWMKIRADFKKFCTFALSKSIWTQ